MEDIISLQQEFEDLIAHLESLNSIREVTTTNTESARVIIEKMDAVVQSIETFRNSLNEDYLEKVEIFNRAQENLSTAVESFNAQVNKLPESIGANIDPIIHDLHISLQGQIEVISDKIRRFQYLIDQLKQEVNTKVDHTVQHLDNTIKTQTDAFKSEMEAKIQENQNSLLLKITDDNNKTQQRLDKMEKELKFNKVLGIGSIFIIVVLLILFIIKYF